MGVVGLIVAKYGGYCHACGVYQGEETILKKNLFELA